MLRTPSVELRTISVKDSERRTRNAERNVSFWLEEVLLHVQSHPLPKVLFGGEGVGEIASYVAGWLAGKRLDVIVLDGANRFDPYTVSFFARRAFLPPEELLKRIRIARAFTCYQMATLMGEKLTCLLKQEGTIAKEQKPWVILLGPITTFLDEDIPEKEVGPLLERSLKRLDSLAVEGIPFFLFQSLVPARSKRAYLMRRLFQFSTVVWRMSLDDEGPKVTLEKGPIENCGLRNLEDKTYSRSPKGSSPPTGRGFREM